jgi:hypothetical protein
MTAVVPLAMILSACEGERGCIPTRLTVRDGAALNASDIERSGILQARLVARGAPLKGKKVSFYIERKRKPTDENGTFAYVGSDRTHGRGRARYDLTTRRDVHLVTDLMAEEYAAVFSGGRRYCSSYAQGAFELARADVPERLVGPPQVAGDDDEPARADLSRRRRDPVDDVGEVLEPVDGVVKFS